MNYKIKPGDTLSSIATRFNTGVNKLLQKNPEITNPNVIAAGDVIKVPGKRDEYDNKPPPKDDRPSSYTVKSGDTLGGIAETFKVRLGRLVRANPQIENPNVIDVGDKIKIPGKGTAEPAGPVDSGGASGPSGSSRRLRWMSNHQPRANYERVPFRGVTVDKYTRRLLLRTEAIAKKLGGPTPLQFWQGSYNPGGVAASGGTHDGGGAVDVKLTGMSQSDIKKTVKAMRMAGFAAWNRQPPTFSTPHIHAVAIGNSMASPSAKAQVQQYFNGQNGLADYGRDGDADVGRPVPNWAKKFNQ